MLLPCSWRREAEKRPAEGEKTGCHGKTPSQRQLLRRLALIKPKARPMKKVHKLVTILRPKPIDNRQKKGYNLVAIKLQANCTIAFFMISPYDPDADLSPPTAVLELRFWVCINS